MGRLVVRNSEDLADLSQEWWFSASRVARARFGASARPVNNYKKYLVEPFVGALFQRVPFGEKR